MATLKILIPSWPQIAISYPPGLIEVATTILCQILGFWLPCILYLLIDLAFPTFSNKHKTPIRPPPTHLGRHHHCFRRVFTTNLLSTLLHIALNSSTNFQYSFFTITPTYPTARELATDFIYASLLRELLFYTVHRTLHHPKLYPRFHKQHHTFTAPMAFAAQYAHPLEHLLANAIPVVLPLALRCVHVLSFALFLTSMLAETASVHSGYDFAGARKHDLHHEKFRVNYGVIGLLDWVLGTDVEG
ncbi:C-4 methylsterol oxidase [Paracoccidioides lutzii Pb01]|uniref:C-4 methylsterol oxidase n=1 Tax=Paracoccidioides lutzii (strain ATCC MYA-826 / Pb01) TaxID=502779 RepID=C1GXX0_PARBA|nr:C-4 methylsterol oxidase [Paracoccidioides lutzii Pb01]EEH41690.1 C-4 methylsterol oxidase [Paracoccidioides lutzii Pb01]